MCEPPFKRSRTASVGTCDKAKEDPANMKDSVDMFDTSGDDQDLPSSSNGALNGICLGWSGVPFASLPRLHPHGSATPAPPPVPGPCHTVAVKLPLKNSSSTPSPHPATFRDVWDSEHVRLPWSKENLYPQEQEGRKMLASRWQLVVSALTSDPITSSRELEQAIMSYNTRYKDKYDWSFDGLHHLFEEVLESEEVEAFFGTTLPGMVELLTASPSILTSPLPLLKAGKTHSITLSQQQVAVVLVNAFFCTFPRRNASKPNSEFSNYPMINFNALFMKNSRRMTACLEKLKCLLCYFSQVVTTPRTGVITFSRLSLTPSLLPSWHSSDQTLSCLHISTEGKIETDGAGFLQADFANEYVGGGVLRSGLVQEEIRFTICPELIATMLFSEAMQDTEAISVIGVEQFSCYSGYGDSFRFEGRMKDLTERDTSGRRLTCVVAMDAIRFSGDKELQFRMDKVERELNKAFVAYGGWNNSDVVRLPAIATGNWGCGAFGGDPRLKLLIQLMAASVAGRDLAYFTFGDEELTREGGRLFNKLAEDEVTVGQLIGSLASFYNSTKTKDGRELYEWVLDQRRLKSERIGGVYDADTDGDSCDNSKIKKTENHGKENCSTGEQSKSGSVLSENTENQEVGNISENHAQGMLTILDSMEKGELVNTAEHNIGIQEDSTEKCSSPILPANKQSKMTDFFKK